MLLPRMIDLARRCSCWFDVGGGWAYFCGGRLFVGGGRLLCCCVVDAEIRMFLPCVFFDSWPTARRVSYM